MKTMKEVKLSINIDTHKYSVHEV